eukprot:TRINITY_DN9110_c0_g1_i1.p1 TRINITY_DN9110_c0_g1~~TRINITY_DN9110_c0_g1_i1.p1  ORF type:complete len:347 (+),score=55.78 TRINITY_DN9110_c0_g1_i1:25-1041(+)
MAFAPRPPEVLSPADRSLQGVVWDRRCQQSLLRRIWRTLSLRHVAVFGLLVLYFSAGIAYFTWQEGWSAADCVYFCVMMITTVGYGDVAPATPQGRLATCIFSLAAAALVANALADMVLGLATAGPLENLARHLPGGRSGDSEHAQKKRRLRLQEILCLILLTLVYLAGHFLLDLTDWRDCAYFAVVTVTSIGFGDIAPETPSARLAMALITALAVPMFGSTFALYVDVHRLSKAQRKHRSAAVESDAGRAPHELAQRLAAASRAVVASLNEESNKAGGTMPTLSREDFLAAVLVRCGAASYEDIASFMRDLQGLQDAHQPSISSDNWKQPSEQGKNQ